MASKLDRVSVHFKQIFFVFELIGGEEGARWIIWLQPIGNWLLKWNWWHLVNYPANISTILHVFVTNILHYSFRYNKTYILCTAFNPIVCRAPFLGSDHWYAGRGCRIQSNLLAAQPDLGAGYNNYNNHHHHHHDNNINNRNFK